MADVSATRKPTWSLDVKLISHLSDLLDQASDYAIDLENGQGGSYRNLKSLLFEVYLRLGGDIEHKGNMLDPESQKQLESAFKELEDIEANQQGKDKIEYKDFVLIKGILRVIRGLLYVEQNRLFIKFITIYSPEEKADRYSHGRAEVVVEGDDV